MRKELVKKKGIYITILIFVILSALLMTIGTVIIMKTAGSMDSIFDIAKPPHFLQMHSGEINQEEIDRFAQSVDYVIGEETVELLNIDATSIWYQRHSNIKDKDNSNTDTITNTKDKDNSNTDTITNNKNNDKSNADISTNSNYEMPSNTDNNLISMAENMMDNAFVKQNHKFDYLLDQKNQIISQEDGYIGVPVNYQAEYDLAIGDFVIISQGDVYHEYKINAFVRDAQMASTMASSTRFLMSNADYEELKSEIGEVEYIIEFRLTDSNYASKFQKLYEAVESNMPKEGQGITYPLIKLVNALSSGLLAGMMILISLLLILIAAFVLKFTILAALEEEVHEIGVMKAIGIANKEIQKQYLLKYKVIAVVGCVCGYGIGLGSSSAFTKGIQEMFGEKKLGILGVVLPLVSVGIVYWVIVHYTKKVLKRIKKITVVQALVQGETGFTKKKKKASTFGLLKYCNHHVNGYLGLKELWMEKRMWMLIVVTFLLATNIILNPWNLVNTFQAPEFASYMGTANSDVQVILQAKEQVDAKCTKLLDELYADDRIQSIAVYSLKKYKVLANHEEENLQIQYGDYSEFAIDCMEGRMPKETGEVAISYLNKEKLEKKLEDDLCVIEEGGEVHYKICGIYQDITSGGYTAKAFLKSRISDAQRYMILFNCKDKGEISEIAAEYDQKYESAKVLPMKVYSEQTFGNVVNSFAGGMPVILAVAVLIIILIMVLFLKLQGAKKLKELTMLRVMGFGWRDLFAQYVVKSVVAAGIGIVIGVVTSNTLGATIIGFALACAGLEIVQFKYISNPMVNWVLCPMILIAIAVIIVFFFARGIRRKTDVRSMQE